MDKIPNTAPKSDPVVYLCGRIAGCSEEEKNGWRNAFSEAYPHVRNPMHRPFNEHGTFQDVCLIVNGDKADIDASDAILVYYVSPSVGTSMEILYAWERGKIVIVWNVSGGELSPWIRFHAHYIVDSQQEALHRLREE